MYRTLMLLLLIVSTAGGVNAQSYRTAIKTEALKMARALAAMDLETYASFSWPALSADADIKSMLKSGIDSASKFRQQMGIKVKSIVMGNPSDVITYKGVKQCTIPQMLTLEAFGGSMKAETTLVGLSTNGERWYFVEALFYQSEKLSKKLPALSPGLKIPSLKTPSISGMENIRPAQ